MHTPRVITYTIGRNHLRRLLVNPQPVPDLPTDALYIYSRPRDLWRILRDHKNSPVGTLKILHNLNLLNRLTTNTIHVHPTHQPGKAALFWLCRNRNDQCPTVREIFSIVGDKQFYLENIDHDTNSY